MKYWAEHFRGAFLCLLLAAAVALAASGCTQTDSSLGVGQENAADSARFPSIDGVEPGASQSVAIPEGVPVIGRVYFSPVVGAPAGKVAVIASQLGPLGSTRGIAIVGSTDQSRTHEIKGYFSAFSENGSTMVIHVWDVILPSGQRVHRIQGQEKVAGDGDDPWAVVPDATMATIADKMLAEFASWRASGV